MTTEPPEPPEPPDCDPAVTLDVEPDDVYEALADPRRRYVLSCLQTYVTPMALADLADEVAMAEHDATRLNDVSPAAVKSLYLDLYHVHVPKLATLGLVEFDREREVVAPAAAMDEITGKLSVEPIAKP